MTSLVDACRKVLAQNPNKYIHCVNEFDDVYQFIMLNNGENNEGVSIICDTPMIDKKSGVLKDGTMLDAFKMGEYTQYSRDEIESILGNSRKAS